MRWADDQLAMPPLPPLDNGTQTHQAGIERQGGGDRKRKVQRGLLLAGLLQEPGEIDDEINVLRLQLMRAPQVPLGLCDLASAAQREAEPAVRLGIVGIVPQRQLQGGDCLLRLAHGEMQPTLGVSGLDGRARSLLRQRHGAGETGLRLHAAALPVHGHAQQALKLRMAAKAQALAAEPFGPCEIVGSQGLARLDDAVCSGIGGGRDRGLNRPAARSSPRPRKGFRQWKT